jgi:hypothetical protein
MTLFINGPFGVGKTTVGVCLKAGSRTAFGTEIRTEGLEPAAVADQILESLPVSTEWSRSR